ncbi:flavoprotein [Streptomyces sp. NPDC094438]|uniref:flavoprotein n=1 Tax=Streptomyces sp. NPDC094438 TaxID=3366061 RepID=UPI00382F4C2F
MSPCPTGQLSQATRAGGRTQARPATGNPDPPGHRTADGCWSTARPHVLLVAPLTSNTLTKWATAMSDTLALGLITEGIGMGLPIVALPHFNDAQAAHPAIAGHVDTLTVRLGPVALLRTGATVAALPRGQEFEQSSFHTPPSRTQFLRFCPVSLP